eukprot:4900539-Amphidinium_carterae.1
MRFATVTVAPQRENEQGKQPLSKTGTIDDTVVVDDPPWLGPALLQRKRSSPPSSPLFASIGADLVRSFSLACTSLGIPAQCLYQLRHGGASEDLLSNKRSVSLVKARGRWLSDSSLRRYAKPAQVHRLLHLLSPKQRAQGVAAWSSFPRRFGVLKSG